MEGTELTDSDQGTPQGGLISPVLANVYLHYALDLWAIHRVKKLRKGQVESVRFCRRLHIPIRTGIGSALHHGQATGTNG